MKLTAIHDDAGNIARLIAYPEDVLSVRPELKEGEQATEVDAQLDDPENIPEQLADLSDNYRLESDGDRGRLVRRD